MASKKPLPKCADCGETDRRKFYAHPTTASGCQRRCKPCDNTKRMAYQRKARPQVQHQVKLVAGVEGMSLYLNGFRIAGPKPWGGGVVRNQWDVDGFEILTALRRATPAPGATPKEES